uniref:Wsv303-like protein n=1 Tax=Trachysalambria curvirostris nimavirus TaxID=2984282 RepID=A0A9C7BWU4_9VIRU|nr:MAG: wsv303-like protein [Trachysalambria curvirostris nimavirus]
MAVHYASHLVYGKVDYTQCSTDNNCVSISVDFGQNHRTDLHQSEKAEETGDDDRYDTAALAAPTEKVDHAHLPYLLSGHGKRIPDSKSKAILSRARMILSERDTSQKQFTALKSRAAFYSVLKFETGAVIVVGLQDPSLTKLCVAKAVTDIADTLTYPIKIRSVSIVNTVSTFNRFHLNFTRISEFFNRHCVAYIYNPETFPGMFFKLRVPAQKLGEGETLGGYYTKVAAMRDSKCPSFRMSDWLRVKTVLTFKVGKNTVLGECGRDDVSVISKLLFGLFHYFMDHNIKLSRKEAKRLRDRYGIPPLEWYLHVDILFHSHPYVKPTRGEVEEAMIKNDSTGIIDETYYGNGNYPEAPLSANLLPSTEDTVRALDAMVEQKLCGPTVWHRRCVLVSDRPRGWWRKKKERSDPFDLLYVGSAAEPLASGMNGKVATAQGNWWLEEKFGTVKDQLVDLCYSEIINECEDANLIPAALIRNYVPTDAQRRLASIMFKWQATTQSGKSSSVPSLSKYDNYVAISGRYSLAGARGHNVRNIHLKHSVSIARLETHLAAYKFISGNLLTGIAPGLAEFLGTDVYSLLSLIKNVPKSRGHTLCISNEQLRNSSSAFKTPGDAFFSDVFDETDIRSQSCRLPKPMATAQAGGSSITACEVCGAALAGDLSYITRSLCEYCDEQSVQYTENALCDIRTGGRAKTILSGEDTTGRHGSRDVKAEESNEVGDRRSVKRMRYTPSDFIESVVNFRDEQTGVPKVGLEFKVNDVFDTLISTRGMEDRPTANYRTSLHTDTQNKSNLTKFLVAALRESGASEDEAEVFNRILGSERGLTLLCELTRGDSKTTV